MRTKALTRTAVAPFCVATLIALCAVTLMVGCGGGGGGTIGVAGTPPPVDPAANQPVTGPDRAPLIANETIAINTTSGGAGTVSGSSITLPVGGGTLTVTLDASDPEGSIPVVVVSVFNNNTGVPTEVRLATPTAGTTYTGSIPIDGNRNSDGLAVTYLLTVKATDGAGNVTTVSLATVLVPGASSPPAPPPPAGL